jgi:hypothetical protein
MSSGLYRGIPEEPGLFVNGEAKGPLPFGMSSLLAHHYGNAA